MLLKAKAAATKQEDVTKSKLKAMAPKIRVTIDQVVVVAKKEDDPPTKKLKMEKAAPEVKCLGVGHSL